MDFFKEINGIQYDRYLKVCYGPIDKEKLSPSIEIVEGVTTIKERAFMDCTRLVSVKLPNSLKFLQREAFLGCKNLKEIQIPSGVDYIDDYVFSECERLEKIIFPLGLKYIGRGSFEKCASLNKVILPIYFKRATFTSFAECGDITFITSKVRFHHELQATSNYRTFNYRVNVAGKAEKYLEEIKNELEGSIPDEEIKNLLAIEFYNYMDLEENLIET